MESHSQQYPSRLLQNFFYGYSIILLVRISFLQMFRCFISIYLQWSLEIFVARIYEFYNEVYNSMINYNNHKLR